MMKIVADAGNKRPIQRRATPRLMCEEAMIRLPAGLRNDA
jgi:hypothetical protein